MNKDQNEDWSKWIKIKKKLDQKKLKRGQNKDKPKWR